MVCESLRKQIEGGIRNKFPLPLRRIIGNVAYVGSDFLWTPGKIREVLSIAAGLDDLKDPNKLFEPCGKLLNDYPDVDFVMEIVSQNVALRYFKEMDVRDSQLKSTISSAIKNALEMSKAEDQTVLENPSIFRFKYGDYKIPSEQNATISVEGICPGSGYAIIWIKTFRTLRLMLSELQPASQ